jgi:hypothetical protein
MSAERPQPRRLGEDQRLPGDFLVAFTEQLMDRRAQLLRQGQPPQAAREQTVAEAVQRVAAGAAQRGWTVAERRIASLAGDILGLEEEYRDQHGYAPEQARLFATGEVLDGERARPELPAWMLPPPSPPGPPGPPGRADPDRGQRPPSARARLDSRTGRDRTGEGGGER